MRAVALCGKPPASAFFAGVIVVGLPRDARVVVLLAQLLGRRDAKENVRTKLWIAIVSDSVSACVNDASASDEVVRRELRFTEQIRAKRVLRRERNRLAIRIDRRLVIFLRDRARCRGALFP